MKKGNKNIFKQYPKSAYSITNNCQTKKASKIEKMERIDQKKYTLICEEPPLNNNDNSAKFSSFHTKYNYRPINFR